MLTLLKNQRVFLGDVEYLVISGSPESETLLENKLTGERTNINTYSLVTKYLTGEFKTAAQRRAQAVSDAGTARQPARMDNLSVQAKKETHRRIDYLVRLQNAGSFGKSRKELRKDLNVIAAARGDPRVPHESSIYRWRRRYFQAHKDVRALFARFDEQGGKGKSRLQPAVEAFIDDAVDEIAFKQRTFSANELLDAVKLKIDRANRERPQEDQLKVPGLRTMQRRAAMLAEYDLTVAAASLREAERRFALHGISRQVDRLLEIAEIDHSPIDLLVVGSDRVTVGRPTISVVLDRATRCVLGYHLSLAGHGVPAVFEALRHALMPKAYLTDRYADLHVTWECFGWMERLLMDNGREFHADAVADAMLNLGIACEFAASRTPNDKPHVERFLRTLNYGLIHKLKGTTLAKVHQRIGFKAEEDAVLTLEELDRIIHVWICSLYHLRPHRGLDGRAPISVWRELAKANPPQLKMNAQDVDIEFSECATSRVQHYGIDLNTFVYRSPKLLMLRRLMPEKANVSVKWPRNNVGYIWVWDSTGDEYIKVPNTEVEYDGLTLEQAKAARKAKSEGDPSYAQTRSEAGAIIRGMVAQADSATVLAKRRKGGRLANRTSRDARDAEQVSGEASVDDGAELDPVALDEVIGEIVIDLPAIAEEA
jgi:putative transposase